MTPFPTGPIDIAEIIGAITPVAPGHESAHWARPTGAQMELLRCLRDTATAVTVGGASLCIVRAVELGSGLSRAVKVTLFGVGNVVA